MYDPKKCEARRRFFKLLKRMKKEVAQAKIDKLWGTQYGRLKPEKP